jgi:hypothetical protein
MSQWTGINIEMRKRSLSCVTNMGMNRTLKTAALAACLGLASCDTSITAPEMVGEWGGEHILLIVSLSGSTVEYDCAHGTIEGSIATDNDGSFTLSGTHVREHGGPVREDEIPDEHPAQYQGWTNGRGMMSLTVTLIDTGESMGTYWLWLGEQPQLFKCL